MDEIRHYTKEEWFAEGERRFGKDFMNWKFECPMCGHVATVIEYKEVGAKNPNCAYVECIGRYTGQPSPGKAIGNGCDWAAYGLFGIPKGGVMVDGQHIFDFADE